MQEKCDFELAVRKDNEFQLVLEIPDHGVLIIRGMRDRTDVIIPDKKIVFRGTGPVASENFIDIRKMIVQAISYWPVAKGLIPVLTKLAPGNIVPMLFLIFPLKAKQAENSGTDFEIIFGFNDEAPKAIVSDQGKNVEILLRKKQKRRISLFLDDKLKSTELPDIDLTSYKISNVDRNTMCRTVKRGLLRFAELQYENDNYLPPANTTLKVPDGKLIIEEGRRILLLSGHPMENGIAHGKLLKNEIRKVVDSTLYTMGLVYTAKSGKWFPAEIREAWKCLKPYISQNYLEEMKGISIGSNIKYEEIRLANCFPELFHCSGFAVKGDATVGGKLYHGRVLDYVIDIGLQYNAVVIVSRQPGKLTFANIGYAGFSGCVSGMNEKGIAIGEMGGRGGQGDWNGMPMNCLIRKTLEEAPTLQNAKKSLPIPPVHVNIIISFLMENLWKLLESMPSRRKLSFLALENIINIFQFQ